jgi:hypothetical protein
LQEALEYTRGQVDKFRKELQEVDKEVKDSKKKLREIE